MLQASQTLAIYKKNLRRNLSNKKALLSHFVFPIIVSLIYYYYKSQQNQQLNPIIIILNFLITIYLGLINSSVIKEVITLFVNQREEGSRQYQYVMGLDYLVHTFANLSYMFLLSSLFLLPFYITVNLFGFQLVYILNFSAFIISTNLLTITLTSFFTEHKVATEVIGIIFSLIAFLPFMYQANQYNFKHYIVILLPNSAFTLAMLQKDKQISGKISLFSLLPCIVYVFVFYVMEFRQNFLQKLYLCIKCLKIILRIQHPQSNQTLMNQIEIQASSVLSSSQPQDDQMRLNVPALQLVHIQKKFGEVTAVDNVSFKIYKSEIFGLLGRNGAGKTTLVDMITKVTQPTSGKIKFFSDKQGQNKSNIGICYQHQILYQDLSVIDHLKFYSQIKGIQDPRQQIQKLVSKVGIQSQLTKKVKQLSGGNKRKLSFCIALLKNPQLLIFDEPTSGLDPHSRRNVWQILQQLRSSQTTIILTTHHLDQADHLSDRICVIKKGKIIQQGTPTQIKQKHGKGYYLTLYHSPSQQNIKIPFQIKLYTKILSQSLKSYQIIDHSVQYIKYFINQNIAYKQLIKCIETLQRIDSISIVLQTNNLEQSFIALNNFQEKIGVMQQQNTNNNNINNNNLQNNFNTNNISSQQQSVSNISQILGVMLKNLYCYIYKFHYIYNLNIIILIFITVVNNILLSKLQLLKNDQFKAPQKNKTNPFFIIQGYILMSSAFMSIPVLQKQQKIIQLLRTRGLKTINYWVGHFLFDFSYFWINFIVVYWWFAQQMKDIPVWVLISTSGSMILYSYTISMIFNKVKTANSWFTFINSILWLVMIPLMIPQSIIKNSFYRYLWPLKYLTPYFDVSKFLMRSQEIFKAMEMLSQQTVVQKQQKYVSHICLIIYLILFMVLQSKIIQKLLKRQENQQIQQQIKLQNVYKNYSNVQALNNVSYKINNERVALLGHNGAGKSTTFGLLSAQLNASSGTIYLQKNIKKKYQNIMKSAGICYQEDTLWKFMTSWRALKVISYFVGVKDFQKEFQYIFDSLDIEHQLKHRKIDNLSGGNKRKICMAVCLMGQPNIKLLDQCSTGLDPVSRLSMVNTLKQQSTGTVILTTHSIPQAQQVCSRAIIMKKGQVSQDNKIYKLKQKYYNCYWIQINTNQIQLTIQKMQYITKKIFTNIQKQNYNINIKKSRIQIKKQAIRLSQIMYILSKAKALQIIKDFNIDEPKLQDVYLLLNQNQEEQAEMVQM